MEPTVVLMHGLTIVRDVYKQFVGVPEALEARGYRVHRTFVKGGGTLDELAERVWRQIDTIDGPLILLCHSMGGLQARTFLLDDVRARRIQTIATVGTPHHGFDLPWVMSSVDPAYRDMTPAARTNWIARYADDENKTADRHGIRRLSVIAALQRKPSYRRLILPHLLVERLAGPNDGLVPAWAQRWGEVAFDVDLDHMECACVLPPSNRATECVALWVRMAELASAPRA